MIVKYDHPRLLGKPCMVHNDFVPYMDIFCKCLDLTGCKAVITSSYREKTDSITGAVVKPAKRSNHFIGYAIDVNIIDDMGVQWTNAMLEYPSGKVLDFIQLVQERGVRWGDDFKDYVHFDKPINITDPQKWDAIYNEIHNLSA